MNSENIFNYSDEFLNEILGDLIKLRISNLSNPKSNEFNKQIKNALRKSYGHNFVIKKCKVPIQFEQFSL